LGLQVRIREKGGEVNTLLKPFMDAPVPSDVSGMADVVKYRLAQAAEKLGHRNGKEGVTVPPAEWIDESDEIQNTMRLAWVRGCKSGMLTRQAKEVEK
jgi:hypothetical protein